ncbi:MAG TPA: hypothetical protein PKY31_15510 [Spirochaetota bacterium]|nr:hypothetical protein [Spirochaetota bacterium]
MAQFIAFDPKVEVNGETVLSIVDGMGAFKDRAYKFLADNGIQNPEPGKWYPQQSWLNAFKAITQATGDFTLFNIGKKIPENAQFPPEINTMDKALAAIDVAYHMNHRVNGQIMFDPGTGKMLEGIGHYKFHRAGDREIRMVCENPYPSDFDRGIIEAMAQKFKPAGAGVVIVRLDESQPTRKKGANSCTYTVKW